MRVTGRNFSLAAGIFAAALAWAQSSPDVVRFFQSVGSALAEANNADGLGHADARPFLDKFDPAMPGYAEVRDDVESLIGRGAVGCNIEILADQGDDRKRVLQLDWILEVEDQRPRRELVKCTIEREKKEWRITRFEPLDLFRD